MAPLAFRFYQIQFRSRSLRRFPGIPHSAFSVSPAVAHRASPSSAAPVHSELSLYLCLQFLISVVTVAICFSRFSDCCVSLVRFLLRLDGPNRFSGHFQQDCLGALLHSVLPLSHKPVGHLCCKLYCFLFLKFLEIQRRNAFTLTP